MRACIYFYYLSTRWHQRQDLWESAIGVLPISVLEENLSSGFSQIHGWCIVQKEARLYLERLICLPFSWG
jgi:hypothetical protein